MSTTPDPLSNDDLPETLITARRGWVLLGLDELWRYRELLGILIWRDIKVRYTQTLLGVAWVLLQPASTMLVFTAVFSNLAGLSSGRLPYPLFAYAGLLLWLFIAAAITNAANSIVGSENLLTKVYFPRLIYPLASIGAAVLDFVLGFVVLFLLMAWYDIRPSWNFAFLPLPVLLAALAAVGVGSLLAALNVLYRDVRFVVPFFMQLWMFATPSIYLEMVDPTPMSGDPPGSSRAARILFLVNPMNGLISFFRAAALDMPLPWAQIGYAAAISVALFIGGCFVFRRLEDSFADII